MSIPRFRDMFPSTIYLSGLAFAVLIIVTNAQPVSAVQDFPGGFVDEMEFDMESMMESQLDRAEESAQRRMKFHINELKRICELTEKQDRTLNVAAKAAVSRVVADMKKSHEQQMGAFGGMGMPAFGAPGDQPEEDDGEEGGIEDEMEPENGFDMAANGAIFMDPGMMSNTGASPEKQKVWKMAVKKALTSEQQEKYKTVVAKRLANARQSAVGHFIAKADRKLLMSEQQRESLFALVDEHFGELMAENEVNAGMGMMMAFPMPNMPGAGGGAEPIDRSLVGKILDDDQIEEWKASFEPKLNEIQFMAEQADR